MDAKITIIVPVYNVEKYLRDCLDSIFRQEFDGYEVICVNDASPDRSAEILAEYQRQHSNMKIITHEKNKGLSAARNTGLRAATGKYIWFVDSDDMIADHKDAMQTLYDYAERTEAQILYFNLIVKWEYKEKEWISYNHEFKEYPGVYSGKELFACFMRDKTKKIEAWRQFFRRDYLLDNQLYFYEGILHEDELFSFLCAMRAERAGNINRDYYVYRKRDSSITSHIQNENIESRAIVVEEIHKWWVQNEGNLTEKVNQAIYEDLLGLVSSIRYNIRSYDKTKKASVGSYARRSYFDLWIRNDLYASIPMETLEQLKQYKAVIVYGAGRAAEDVIPQLSDAGITPYAAAVSDRKGNPETVCGIPVKSIEELTAYRDSAIVVLAVTERYRGDIEANLKRLHFQNVV